MEPDPWAYAHGTGSIRKCSWNRFHEHMLMEPTPWAEAHGNRLHEHMLMEPTPWAEADEPGPLAYAHGTGSMSICAWNRLHE